MNGALDFRSILTIVLSDINFMLAMLIVVLFAACFLGRYIVITRKMVIATLGVFVVNLIFILVSSFVINRFFPELNDFETLNSYEKIIEAISDNDHDNLYYLYTTVMSLVLNALVFLYAFIFYYVANKEKKLLRAIESTVCLIFFYQYLNTVALYTYVYLKGGSSELYYSLANYSVGYDKYELYNMIFLSAAFLVIFLLLYFVYFKKKRFFVMGIGYRIFFVVWLGIFQFFSAVPLAPQEMEYQYKLLSMVFGLLIPFIGTIIPLMIIMNIAEGSLKERNKYQEEYLAAELDYIEQYKRSQVQTRAFRHDIINNLSLTSMMLDEGKTDEANQHLKELLGNVKALSPSIITGDEMLDCIVSMKADKMEELGISFTLDGVADGGLNMKPMDECSIFANALDNAIEAVVSMDENEKNRFIDMNIKRTEKFFIIRIKNSAASKVDVDKLFMVDGYTSKKDTEHHGFGLKNIRNTVENYNGMVRAESDDTTFSLSIMIPR